MSTGTTPRPRGNWPERIGILNDYVRIPYANGSSFASQFLYREFSKRGHEVTVVGPRDPIAQPHDLPKNHVLLRSVAMRNHPGVFLPLPTPTGLREVRERNFDIILAQTCSAFMDLGAWLRAAYDIPYLCVNTVHLPSVYNVLLTDRMLANPAINGFFGEKVIPWTERMIADNYNNSDGLIVLSRHLEQYWRDRGVTVPIHVIPRAIEPRIFDQRPEADPFHPSAKRGFRLLNVCRHTREKGVERLLDIFAKWIAPEVPEATLTLVGDGPDHDSFRAHARALGVEDRVFFPGEYPVTQMPAWYRHADVFLYTSLSETYGQVVSEALWCGLPTVAFADGMGVSQQIDHGVNGLLVNPGPDEAQGDWHLGNLAVALLRNRHRRSAVAEAAERFARERSEPGRCMQRYSDAFLSARRHSGETKHLRSRLGSARYLARWTAIQLATAGFALMRPPATLNRHGRRQPNWDLELVDLPDASTGELAADERARI